MAKFVPDWIQTQPAIERLIQAQQWMTDALAYAQQDTIEGYLKYYETGYTSGNWHFPTHATHYEHGIGHRLAKMFEEELLQETGFFFRYSPRSYQDFSLYFDDELPKVQEDHVRYGMPVANIAIWKRELTIGINIGTKIEQLEANIKLCQNDMSRIKIDIIKMATYVENRTHPFWITKKRKASLYQKLSKWHDKQEETIKSLVECIERDHNRIIQLNRLAPKLDVLKGFEMYGFTIIPYITIEEEASV